MDSYKKLFSYLPFLAEDASLSERVLARVAHARRRMLRLRVSLFGTGALVSLLGLIPVGQLLLEKVSTTGFYQYLTLALSGDGAVYLFWKELLWSLLESAPLVSLLLVLCTLAALVWSLAQTVTAARRLSIA